MDTANIALGALVFGQILSPEGFQISLGIAGVVIYAVIAAVAYLLTRPVKKR